jgi:hypothetical protein
MAKAESNSGAKLSGVSYPYTITVNPVPSITTAQNKTICSNTAFSIIPSNGSGNTFQLELLILGISGHHGRNLRSSSSIDKSDNY